MATTLTPEPTPLQQRLSRLRRGDSQESLRDRLARLQAPAEAEVAAEDVPAPDAAQEVLRRLVSAVPRDVTAATLPTEPGVDRPREVRSRAEPGFVSRALDVAGERIAQKFRPATSYGGDEPLPARVRVQDLLTTGPSRAERTLEQRLGQYRTYRPDASPEQLEALLEEDLRDLEEHEGQWSTMLGTLLGDLADPTMLVGGVAGERAAMAGLQQAAKRGAPLAGKLLRLATTPEGAPLVRRLVARATHGLVTGGAANVGFQAAAAGQEGRIPSPGEAAHAFAVGTVVGPILEPVVSLAGVPVTAGARRVRDVAGRAVADVRAARATGGGGRRPGLRERLADMIDPERAQRVEQLEVERRAAQRAAETDALTGVGNRAAFDRARATADADPNTEVVMFDVNNLKAANDLLGHEAGDQAVSQAAAAIQRAQAEAGVPERVFRYAGDEFVAIVPKGQGEAVRVGAERVYGRRPAGEREVSLSGNVGATLAEADAGLIRRKASRPPAERYRGGEVPTGIVRMAVEEVVADPGRFQFKSLGPEGVGAELKNVRRWNEQLAGIVSVWRDPADGRVYVVNGHHRLDLARRLGVKDINVQFVVAPDAAAARAAGAFINMAEGRGTATDVAKFLRDTGTSPEQLDAFGISLKADLARRGVALSRLAPDLFDEVATGKLPDAWGVVIGELLTDPVLQREAVKAARSSSGRLSQSEVTEIARQVRDAGTEGVSQETLFGTETERHGLYVHRAQVAAAMKKRLASDRRLFGFVAREGRAEELARAGETRIDVEAARGLAETSSQAAEIFDRLYTRSGPLAEVVTEGARRVARGERVGSVVQELYPAIRDAVGREIGGGAGTVPPASGLPRPEPQSARSVADEITGAEEGRVATSQDPAQGAMFSPARPSVIRPTAGETLTPEGVRVHGDAAVAELRRGDVGPTFQQRFQGPSGEQVAERFWRHVAGDPQLRALAERYAGRVPTRPSRAPAVRQTEPPSALSTRPALELRGEPEGPAQASMFGGREGTSAARSLVETEAMARGELTVLRERFRLERDPTRRATLAVQIAEREKLVNRAQAISADELQARAAAERAVATEVEPDQLALLAPNLPAGYREKLVQGGTTLPSPEAQAEIRTLMEISRRLAEAVRVPLRQGRFRGAVRKAASVFFPHSEVARVQRFDKLDTVAHEIGHFLSKRYLRNPTMRSDRFRGVGRQPVLLPKEAVRELVQMGRDLYGERKPAGGYGEEGIAEWVSFYVTDPTTLATKAPTFTAFMDGVFAQERLLKSALDQAREAFATYQRAPAAARFDAQISVGERQRIAVTTREYMRVVWDDTYDVQWAVRELGEPSSPAADASILARLSRGAYGEAEEWLERGVRKLGTAEERLTAGIVKTLTPIFRKGRAQALRRYLDAESALERWSRGIDPGFSQADAQAMVELYGKDPQIRAAAEAAWAHSRALLQLRRDIGLLSDAQYQQIVKANQRRVGFYRVFAPEEAAVRRGGGRGGLGSSGVKRQTGSARRVMDPIEAILQDTYQTAVKIRQHQAVRALVEQALGTEGGGRVIEEVPAPQRPVRVPLEKLRQQLADLGIVYEATDAKTGERFTVPLNETDIDALLTSFQDARVAGPMEPKDLVFPILRGGELHWYAVKDRPLYDALVGLGPQELDLWRRILSAPKRLLQTGATTTFEFAFGNLGRDVFGQSIFTRASWRPPLWRHAEGAWHIIRRDPVYQRFRLHGAEQATMAASDRPRLQFEARRLFGYFRTLKQAWLDRRQAWGRASLREKGLYALSDVERVVLSPLEAIRSVRDLLEKAGRVGEFAAVERQALGRGAMPVEAATEGALAGRDVGIDFQQLGSATRQVNHLVAFFGAYMRGWAQLGRELSTRPKVIIPRIVATITVPSLALYWLQRKDPIYRDMPAWKRDMFWIYVVRGDDQGEGWDGYGSGKVERILMWPKPFELGQIFGTLPERAAAWLDGTDPAAGERMAEAMKRMAPPVIPTALVPLIENYANRSTFRDRPIVPRSREGLAPEAQTTERNGETVRLLGDALGYSPAKLENLIRGYTGGAGMYAVEGTDALIRGVRAAEGKPPLAPVRPGAEEEDPLLSVPGLRRFLSRIPGADAESVERLYRNFARAEQHRRTWRTYLTEGRSEQAEQYLKAHREEIISVGTSEELGEGQQGPLRAAYLEMQDIQEARRAILDRGTPEARARAVAAMRRLAALMRAGGVQP